MSRIPRLSALASTLSLGLRFPHRNAHPRSKRKGYRIVQCSSKHEAAGCAFHANGMIFSSWKQAFNWMHDNEIPRSHGLIVPVH